MRRKIPEWFICGLIGLIFFGIIISANAENQPQILTIQQAIEIARKNSLQRKISEGDLRIANDKLAQAQSGYFPKLTLNAGYTHYNEEPTNVELGNQLIKLNNGLKTWADYGATHAGALAPVFGGLSQNLTTQKYLDDTLDYYGFSLILEQPLYTGSKLTALNKQAKANQDYAKVNLDSTDYNLAYDVKKAYYTVISTQQFVTTMEDAVHSMEEHVKEANAYYKAGIVPKLDVMRAEVKLTDLKQKLLMAQNGLSLAKMALNFTLGVDLGTDYKVVDELKYEPFQLDLQICQDQALANRPEVKAIKLKVEMAQENITIVKSAGKPIVAFRVESENFQPYNPDPSLQIGVVASMKLLDGGQIRNQVAEAQEILKQAQTGQELTNRAIKLEVEQAYHNLQAALETIQVAEKSLVQAQETVRMAEVSYKAGLSTSLERIDAEVGLTQAKTNYTQALSLYQIALAQLDKAMGK